MRDNISFTKSVIISNTPAAILIIAHDQLPTVIDNHIPGNLGWHPIAPQMFKRPRDIISVRTIPFLSAYVSRCIAILEEMQQAG